MRILVFCVCVLACASFGTAGKVKTELHKAAALRPVEDIDACFDEVGLNRENAIKEQDILNDVHLQPEMEERRVKTGCVMECCFKKWHMMDESGINEDGIKAGLTTFVDNTEEPKANEIIHGCVQQTKDLTGHCEKGFKMFECVTKAIHECEHEEHEEHEDPA